MDNKYNNENKIDTIEGKSVGLLCNKHSEVKGLRLKNYTSLF